MVLWDEFIKYLVSLLVIANPIGTLPMLVWKCLYIQKHRGLDR